MRHWGIILENDERGRRLEKAHQEDPHNDEVRGSYVAHLRRVGDHSRADMVELHHHGRNIAKADKASWLAGQRSYATQGHGSESDRLKSDAQDARDAHEQARSSFMSAARRAHGSGGNPALAVATPYYDDNTRSADQSAVTRANRGDHIRRMSHVLHSVRGVRPLSPMQGDDDSQYHLARTPEIAGQLSSAIKQRYPDLNVRVEPSPTGYAHVHFTPKEGSQ